MENEWITLFRQIRQPVRLNSSAAIQMAGSAAIPEKYEDRQTIEMLRAVLRKLFGLQYGTGGDAQKPFLFILFSGEEGDTQGEGCLPLSETIRRGVTRGSADLPLQIVWVEDCYGVGGDPNGEYVPSNGAVVRFTNVRREGAGFALIDGNLHLAGSEPRGFEYVVEKKNGFWIVRSSYHQWID